MKKYEYMSVPIEHIADGNAVDEILDKLNEKGANGWKLVPCSFLIERGQMLLEREKKK